VPMIAMGTVMGGLVLPLGTDYADTNSCTILFFGISFGVPVLYGVTYG
jgi:hypothetical protein